MTDQVITPEIDTFARTQLAVVEQVSAIVVTTDPEMRDANEKMLLLRGAAKALEEKRVYLKEPYLEGGRRIDEFFNGPIAKIATASKALKLKIDNYLTDQRRRAEEEAERLRKAQQAERDRLEREARAREVAAAEARAKAEAEARAKREASDKAAAEGRAAEAAKLAEQARGTLEAGISKAATLDAEADAKRQTAQAAPSAQAPKVEAPKGFSTRVVYGCEVVNFKALIEAVARGEHPANFLLPNEPALRQYAQAAKRDFNVAGCKLTERKA